MNEYEVVVGNIGRVLSTIMKHEAVQAFKTYVEKSKAGIGLSARESVYLMENGRPIEEYQGPADDDKLSYF